MIWAILALLGVPLWLCALGILSVVLRNRELRKRYGDIPVRVRRAGKKRWTRGHAIWVSDVFAWRGSPAAWNEDLLEVSAAGIRSADPEESKKLHRLGDDPVIATLTGADGEPLDVAVAPEQRLGAPGALRSHLPRRRGPRQRLVILPRARLELAEERRHAANQRDRAASLLDAQHDEDDGRDGGVDQQRRELAQHAASRHRLAVQA